MKKDEKNEQVDQTAQASFEQGRTQGRQWEKDFEEAVRTRPLASILIAGAVGLMAGLIWQCRRPRD